MIVDKISTHEHWKNDSDIFVTELYDVILKIEEECFSGVYGR